MMAPALFAILASAAAQPGAAGGFVPGSGVRASGQAVVRLLSAQAVPMSSESLLEAPQRRTTLRLADGEHDALLVEFE